MPSLLDPITLGAINAPNRVIVAPCTRGRATRQHVPTPIMIEYYTQRARNNAGLIITEATGISQQGLGWPYAPGIWSDEQRDAWKPITESVHKAGGRIHVQLWHMGRVVHPSLNNGAIPISSSDIKAPGQAHTYDGKQDYVQPRSLPLDEIPALLNDYRRAARNAIDAGFDGIQIHAANGYLLDQFLRDSDNKRTDQYGGSIENRIRLLLEVVKTISEEIGADRVGVRLSPNGAIQGTNDSDPVALFTAAAKGLSDAGIAYLEMREPDRNGTFGKADRDPIAPEIRKVFKGPIILNSDYDPERAQRSLDEGNCDAVAFGRPFIANPDLVYRVVHKLPLNKDNMATWYSQGPEGYIDYPILAKE